MKGSSSTCVRPNRESISPSFPTQGRVIRLFSSPNFYSSSGLSSSSTLVDGFGSRTTVKRDSLRAIELLLFAMIANYSEIGLYSLAAVPLLSNVVLASWDDSLFATMTTDHSDIILS